MVGTRESERARDRDTERDKKGRRRGGGEWRVSCIERQIGRDKGGEHQAGVRGLLAIWGHGDTQSFRSWPAAKGYVWVRGPTTGKVCVDIHDSWYCADPRGLSCHLGPCCSLRAALLLG